MMRTVDPSRALISAAAKLPLPLPHHFGPLPAARVRLTRLFLPPVLRVRSMAAAPAVVSAEDEAKFGFRREEMYKSSLANTADAYDRHVFVSFKGPEAWAPRAEESDGAMLSKLLASAVKTRKDEFLVKTKLTMCGGCDGDVLIFPDMIKYKGLSEAKVDSFVDDVLIGGRSLAFSVAEQLTGYHIFVCSHGSHDRRCGVCGPPLIEKLNEEIECRGLNGRVSVRPCSHIGGHKYAGNLIIYGPDPEGKIAGHWYGYVTPADVPDLLDQHIAKGLIIERLWRGQMGTSFKGGEKAEQPNLLNGKYVKDNEKLQASIAETVKDSSFTCCQGADGVSCCNNQNNSGNNEEKLKESEGERKGPSKL